MKIRRILLCAIWMVALFFGTGGDIAAQESQPDIVLSESEHNFGDVWLGQVAPWTLDIMNEGEGDLFLSITVLPEGGAIGFDPARVPTNWTVSAGDTLQLFLLFVPTSLGIHEGKVVIRSNDPNEPELEVPMRGNGAGTPRLTLSASRHNFGEVVAGNTSDWSLKVGNAGEVDLIISEVTVSTLTEGSQAFFPKESPESGTVAPGAEVEFVLMFMPPFIGAFSGTMLIRSNDPLNLALEVALEGEGVAEAIPDPKIVLSDAYHDFGSVELGYPEYWSFRVRNDGESDLVIDSLTVAPEAAGFGWVVEQFLPEEDWDFISPGEESELMLFFPRLPVEGRQTATATIWSNDPNTPEAEVLLFGDGFRSLRPQIEVQQDRYEFGKVAVGERVDREIRVKNTGADTLRVSISGTSPELDFWIDDGAMGHPTFPVEVLADSVFSIRTYFEPTRAGAQVDTLKITCNDPNRPKVGIVLSGTGAQQDIALSALEHDFGEVDLGSSDVGVWELAIRNEGAAPLTVEKVGIRLGKNYSLGAISLPQLISPGGTLKATVRFTPSETGVRSDVLVVTSDDPDEGKLEVSLIGTGMDRVPPEIVFDAASVPVPEVGSAPVIGARLSDNVAVREAFVFYRALGEAAFDSVAMTSGDGVNFVGQIPSNAVTSSGLVFEIRVSDGTHVRTSERTVMPVDVSRLESPDSTRSEVYQMISIPLTLETASAQQVLEPVLGAYDKMRWRLFRHQGGGYVELGNGIEDFAPGLGFWLITKTVSEMVSGPGRSVVPDAPDGDFVITLQPGWNMIGAPFDFPVAWSQVDLGGKNVEPPVAYDGTFRYNQTILKPWHGYAIKNLEATAVDLRIPPVRAEGAPASKRIRNQPGEWMMDLSVRCGRLGDVENTLGGRLDAHEKWDAHERSEAPPIGDFVTLYFDHSDWERHPGRYTTDFRPAGIEEYVWDFVVGTNAPSEETTLHWEKSLPAEMAGILIDLAQNESVDVTQTDTYRFSFGEQDISGEASESRRAFRLIVGTSGFVAEESAGASKMPDAFRLAQNVPNPFNPRTAIRFEVPGASGGVVELAVFDLLGQKVRTLSSGSIEAGSYELTWDGTDETGRDVSSGVYVARLKGKGFVGVRKMVLIR